MTRFLIIIIIIVITNNICLSQNPLLIIQADEGNVEAQMYLAKNYFDGGSGYEKNYQKAFKYYKLAAQQGNAEAQFWTYLMLAEGIGTIQDEKEALPWLEKSAQQNYHLGLHRMGIHFFDNKDYPRCYEMLSKYESMYGDNPMNDEMLGWYYFFGHNGKNKYEKAKEYFLKALSYKDYNGIFPGRIEIFLGKIYHEGLTEEKDWETAEKYYIKGINKDPEDSRLWFSLGELYLEKNDYSKAKQIWEKILELDINAISSSSPLAAAMGGSVDYLIPSFNQNNEQNYAIVIANENYKRVPNVPFAHNDGKVFYKYLNSSFGIPEENIEYLEDASLNDIKYALANVAQRCNAFKDQVNVIVYYAGHGVPDDKTAEAFLLPVDGFGTDPSSGLNLDDFYTALSAMPAKSVVVLLDACFSGAKRDGGMLMATRGITIKPKMQVPDGKLIVLSATSNDETAFPIDDQKHGLFTYTLLRKIQETGGDITWGELADYVTETVKNRSIDLNGKLQTPTVSVSGSMKDVWRNLKIR